MSNTSINSTISTNIAPNGRGMITAAILASVLTAITAWVLSTFLAVAVSNTALTAISSTSSSYVLRIGFASVGDSSIILFKSSSSACSLASGAGDGGSQVPSSDSKCWLAQFGQSYDVRAWGAGQGSDDSTAINAAIAAAAATGALTAEIDFPPPSAGVYNVCANPIVKPTHSTVNITLRGTGAGEGGVQIPTSCGSPPFTVILDNSFTHATPNVQSASRLRIENLRVNANCKAPHDLVVVNDPGFSAVNSAFRNVAPALAGTTAETTYGVIEDGGSNILIEGGSQIKIDDSNLIENVNDPVVLCYGAYSAGSTANAGLLPPFGLDTWTTDGRFNLPSVGASLANYVQRYGGANDFTGHGWGYAATNGGSQSYSEPLYNYITRGRAGIHNTIFDSPTTAGVRAQVVGTTTGVDYISAVTNAGSGGTAGATTILTGVSGTGTKWTGVGVIGPTGALSSIPWVTFGGNYSANPSLTGETVTATNGLTGVVVNLIMIASAGDASGPVVAEIPAISYSGTAPVGVSVGAGITNLMVKANNFTGVTTGSCVVSDTALDPSDVIGDNIGCPAGYSVQAGAFFFPTTYGAVGTGASTTAGAKLGISTLAGLASYSLNGATPYSFISAYPFGVNFNLLPEQSAYAGASTLNFQITGTIETQIPTVAAASLGASAIIVGDKSITIDGTLLAAGVGVSGPGIFAGTTISSITGYSGAWTINLSHITTALIPLGQNVIFAVQPANASYSLPVASTSGIEHGDSVSGTCIATGAQVDYVNHAKNEIELSKPLTCQPSALETLTFTPSWLSNVTTGMTVLGPAGAVPGSTTVSTVNVGTGVVTISASLTGHVAANQPIPATGEQTTIASGITIGATSMTVASATGWPTSGNYLVQIAADGVNTAELVEVTGGQGTTTWTIVRGGVPSAHGTGAGLSIPMATPITFWRAYTDAEATALQMDRLGLQAAVNAAGASVGGSVQLPANSIYLLDGPVILPIYAPTGSAQAAVTIAGQSANINGAFLRPTKDFGPGSAAVSCGDPTAKSSNARGIYQGSTGYFCTGALKNLSIQPASFTTAFGLRPQWSSVPVAMDGIKQGPRLFLDNVQIEGFDNGSLFAGDHTEFHSAYLTGNFNGLRFDDQQGNLFGDEVFNRLYASGNAWAGISVSPLAYINGVFTKEYLASNAYAIWCEPGPTAGQCLQGVTMTNGNNENSACGSFKDGDIQDGWVAAGGRRTIANVLLINDFNANNGFGSGNVPTPLGGCTFDAYYDMAYVDDFRIEQVWPNDYPVVANAFAYILRTTRLDAFAGAGTGGFYMGGQGVWSIIQAAAAYGENIVGGTNGFAGTFGFTASWQWVTLEGPTFRARPIPFYDPTNNPGTLPMGSLVEFGPTTLNNVVATQLAGTTAGAALAGTVCQNWSSNPYVNQLVPVVCVGGSRVPVLTATQATVGEYLKASTSTHGTAVSATGITDTDVAGISSAAGTSSTLTYIRPIWGAQQ